MKGIIISAVGWIIAYAAIIAIITATVLTAPPAYELEPAIAEAMSAGADRQAQSLIAQLDRMTAELQRLNEQLRAMNEGLPPE